MSGTFAVTSEMKNISVYVQTAYTSNPTDEDLIDFYIDDFKCTKIETGNFDIASLSNNTPLKQLYSAYFKVGTAVTDPPTAASKNNEDGRHFTKIVSAFKKYNTSNNTATFNTIPI